MIEKKPISWKEWLTEHKLGGLLEAKEHEALSSAKWAPTRQDRAAAWALYVELSSRITTTPLRYSDGDEEAALISIHKLFGFTREICKKRGPACSHFATLANLMLNQVVRPFTAQWHRKNLAGHLKQQDNRRIFRQKLINLQGDLCFFSSALGKLAEGNRFIEGSEIATPSLQRHIFDTSALNPYEGSIAGFLGPKITNASKILDAEWKAIVARRKAAYKAPEANGKATNEAAPGGTTGQVAPGDPLEEAADQAGLEGEKKVTIKVMPVITAGKADSEEDSPKPNKEALEGAVSQADADGVASNTSKATPDMTPDQSAPQPAPDKTEGTATEESVKATDVQIQSDERSIHGGLGTNDNGQSLGTIGLSISGGGIRSATFGLGVLHALAKHRVLQDVDYLSTVSGGGYLGCFLSTQLAGGKSIDELFEVVPGAPEPVAVRSLRNNSEYILSKTLEGNVKTALFLLIGSLLTPTLIIFAGIFLLGNKKH